MPKQPSLSLALIEWISKALVDTSKGLTGSEIGHLLANARIVDVDSMNTKRKRLMNAFKGFQHENQFANNIFNFISLATNNSYPKSE